MGQTLNTLDQVLEITVAAACGLLCNEGKLLLPPSDNNGNTPVAGTPEEVLFRYVDNLLYLQVGQGWELGNRLGSDIEGYW